jgi:hypothetical protein
MVSEAFFLRSNKIRPTLLGQHKRLSRTGTAYRKHMSDVRGLTWKTYMSYL